MENREFLEQIQQYAVRIGNAGDKELYGSGTLFLVSKRKKVCVLTAAHVVYSLMEKIKKQELKICLTCKDKKDDIHCIIVDDTKCICIYSEYNKNKRKKEFFNDLALIDIPWESWMDDMTGFRLASGNSGVEIKGYGFPLSLDEEKDRSLADLFAGIECLTGTIESQNVGRLAIKYDEPQLFIEVCEGEESSKEVYRPETYFSTAQLNTVAFSSFFGRALSTNNLPVKTICIDDPIGHFDDMNILGFTDMVRCILEKQDCQIIMSTHEEKVYQIMKRKLDPNFYNTLFIQLDNSEKVIWNRANC